MRGLWIHLIKSKKSSAYLKKLGWSSKNEICLHATRVKCRVDGRVLIFHICIYEKPQALCSDFKRKFPLKYRSIIFIKRFVIATLRISQSWILLSWNGFQKNLWLRQILPVSPVTWDTYGELISASLLSQTPQMCWFSKMGTHHDQTAVGQKIFGWALAGVAQWIEHQPEKHRVAGSIPSQAHAWVAGQVPGGGHMRGSHTLMFLSLSFSLPSPLSKN